jgi:hypothetical protein
MEKRVRAMAWAAAFLLVSGLGRPVVAQSLTGGVLRGTVFSTDGSRLSGVQISVEGRDGRAIHVLETGSAGEFGVPLLAPGIYRVLIEQVGYQPVRLTGVIVVAGQTTSVSARVERRPPPITTVVEIPASGATAGSSAGRALDGRSLVAGDRFRSVTDISRSLSEVDGPRDAREGFALAAGGLPGSASRLYVDGIPEALLRHPGVPSAAASAPLFQRDALAQGQVLGLPLDAEWRGTPGSILAAQTARGSNRISFRPYVTASAAKLGGRSQDNPADSAGTSIQAGAVLSGAIVPDTAHFLLRGDYQQLQSPSAAPWEVDSASYKNGPVSLASTIGSIAKDSFHTSAGAPAVAPVVRTWKGGSGLGRLDWQLNRHTLVLRGGYANWHEDAPLLGDERSTLAGARLNARDWSGAVTVTSTWSTVSNEFRGGLSGTTREWLGAALPATSLAFEGVAFGGSGALPARFEQTSVDVSDAIQYEFGQHRLKAGLNIGSLKYKQDYRYGSGGIYTFGSLDGFGRGEGTYFRAVASVPEPADPSITEVGLFGQDSWSIAPEITLTLGLRYDRQSLPSGRLSSDTKWIDDSGRPNDFVPSEKKGFSPRLGVVWDVRNQGEWIVRADAGLFRGRLDPATFAEVMLFDGRTTVRRGQGSFSDWPAEASQSAAPGAGTRLAMFDSTTRYRKPRSLKANAGFGRFFTGGVSFQVNGSYYHTDYLLRRTDLNRVEAPLNKTQDGRPVFGTLVQQGGLITSAIGSNRRFAEFDLVSGLAPTGFSDYYEFTALLERRLASGLSLSGSYTYSRTRDNLVGALEPDPANQLDPFPQGLNGGDWTAGRSDLDVPHRVVVSAEYRSRGSSPLTLGARWRYRSGLPFTPGFRTGVDVNGDGGGGNDPAALDASASGVSAALAAGHCESTASAIAVRNSCREPSLNGLDAYLAVELPVGAGAGSHLALTVDAFNLVATATGLLDRALYLVNPTGAITTAADGSLVLPLTLNSRFGSLFSRRTDARVIRVGLRVEY